MKRNGIRTAGLAVAVVLALAAGVYAYLTNSQSVTNEFTGGNNDIKVDEIFPKDEIPPLAEGINSYTKTVRVKNQGNVPCYIRVFVDFSAGDIRNISGYSSDGTTYYSAVLSESGLTDDVKDKDGKTVIYKDSYINHLPDGWVYIPETGTNTDKVEDAMGGWFYYTKPVEAGESTADLFKTVCTYFKSKEDISAYQIFVYAESVQIRDQNGNLIGSTTGTTETTAASTTTGTGTTTGTTETTAASTTTVSADAWKDAWQNYLQRSRDIKNGVSESSAAS
jgi:alternate signal-mediated exported protein